MAVHGALMLILTGAGVSLAHDCYTTTSYYNEYYKSEQYSSYPFYCPHGCCGYDPVYCCQDSFVDYYSYADYVSSNVGGVIAGIVIGSLVGLALFIGLIVLICVCCRNANRRSIPGQVITTQGTGAPVTYVNTRKYRHFGLYRSHLLQSQRPIFRPLTIPRPLECKSMAKHDGVGGGYGGGDIHVFGDATVVEAAATGMVVSILGK